MIANQWPGCSGLSGYPIPRSGTCRTSTCLTSTCLLCALPVGRECRLADESS